MATYAFAGDKPERLVGLEATWDPGTFTHLEALGVAPGWRCLEAGAGGGTVAAWLAERVGPDGRVLATDVDTKLLDPLAGGPLEVAQHDLLADELPAGSFDLAHARLLIEWLGESDALERLVAALAPGGWLLVEDFDWAIGGLIGETPEMAKTYDAILTLLESTGYQRHLGRRLLGRLEAAGLEATGSQSRSFVIHGASAGTAFDRFSFAAQRENLLAGWLTEAELDASLAALEDPATHVMTPMMWAAWGRKPA